MKDAAQTLADQILADARKQAEPILTRARREAEDILRRARDDAEGEQTRTVERAEQDAAGEALRIRARTELEMANIRRRAAEDILVRARQQALEALRRQARDDGYRKQLVRLGLAALREMSGERFELLMRQEDKDAHAQHVARRLAERAAAELGRRAEIEVADETVNAIGGLVLRSADGHEVCDQTFRARLDRLWEQLREDVAGDLLADTG